MNTNTQPDPLPTAPIEITVNTRYLTALSKFIAPKADIRKQLNTVMIESEGNKLYYVATDGHKLVVIRDATDNESPVGQWLIPRAIFANHKQQKYERTTATIRINGLAASIISNGVADFQCVDEKFPPWRKIVRRKTSGAPSQIDPKLLLDVMSCYALALENKALLHVHHNGASGCCVLTDGVDFMGMVVPWYVHGQDAQPPSIADWLRRAVA